MFKISAKISFNLYQAPARWIAMMLVFCGVLPLSIEDAHAERFLTIETLQDYDFGTWANAGSLSTSNTVCAVAWDSGAGGKERNYSVRVDALAGSGYTLFLDGDSSANASSRIQINIDHADSLNSSPYETLVEGQWENQKQKGQAPGCPNGDNSDFRVSIESTELSGKLGGTYFAYFQQSIREGNDTATALGSFAVSVTIGGVPQVQISQLDSINFGQHSGLGDLSASESFCIYSSAVAGAYRMSISSTAQDSAGHYLTESLGSDRIPLTILYSANGTGPGTTPVTDNFVSGNGDSASTNCSGSNNTTLTLQLSELDLQAASSGSYTEQLTLLIEPE